MTSVCVLQCIVRIAACAEYAVMLQAWFHNASQLRIQLVVVPRNTNHSSTFPLKYGCHSSLSAHPARVSYPRTQGTGKPLSPSDRDFLFSITSILQRKLPSLQPPPPPPPEPHVPTAPDASPRDGTPEGDLPPTETPPPVETAEGRVSDEAGAADDVENWEAAEVKPEPVVAAGAAGCVAKIAAIRNPVKAEVVAEAGEGEEVEAREKVAGEGGEGGDEGKVEGAGEGVARQEGEGEGGQGDGAVGAAAESDDVVQLRGAVKEAKEVETKVGWGGGVLLMVQAHVVKYV